MKICFNFRCLAQPKERSRNGVTPIKTRTFEAMIAEAAREQMGDMKPLKGYLKVQFGFYALKHRGDLSNCIKSIEDALNRIAYVDDKQIQDLHAWRDFSPRFDHITVEIETIDG